MREKPYYSVRKGRASGRVTLSFEDLRTLFFSAFQKFDSNCYFEKAFGKECVDDGLIPGTLGSDIGGAFLLNLRKRNLWPIYENYTSYSEEDLFDVTEFLHDLCSKPLDGRFHGYANCGYHYSSFDDAAGQQEWRADINRMLRDYGEGFELSPEGEILVLADRGMEGVFTAALPSDDANLNEKFLRAQRKFRHHASSADDRKEAIRELADILEFLRPQLKKVLTEKDESDLFNIVNNFGIRHFNEKQKLQYDRSIWFSWMYYYYSATIHAALRLIEKDKLKKEAV